MSELLTKVLTDKSARSAADVSLATDDDLQPWS
jgi:hypothetical protein